LNSQKFYRPKLLYRKHQNLHWVEPTAPEMSDREGRAMRLYKPAVRGVGNGLGSCDELAGAQKARLKSLKTRLVTVLIALRFHFNVYAISDFHAVNLRRFCTLSKSDFSEKARFLAKCFGRFTANAYVKWSHFQVCCLVGHVSNIPRYAPPAKVVLRCLSKLR